MYVDPVLRRAAVGVLLPSAAAQFSWSALVSVVPLSVVAGGASEVVAGWCTGAMMLAMVLLELVTPRLVDRLGFAATLAAGLVLTGAPAFLLAVSSSTAVVLGVCAARGAGLGLMVVAGIAAMVTLMTADRRGQGLGLFGLASGIAAALGAPSGILLSEHLGFRATFAVGGLAALMALPALAGLRVNAPVPALESVPDGDEAGHRVEGLPRTWLLPAAAFATTAASAGAVVTFLTLAVPPQQIGTAGLALLVFSVAVTTVRWRASVLADRRSIDSLLTHAVLAAALGTALMSNTDDILFLVVGAGIFGIGFGLAQASSLITMLRRGGPDNVVKVTALWNVAYDGGMGLGAVGFGAIVNHAGYPWAFATIVALQAGAALRVWAGPKSEP